MYSQKVLEVFYNPENVGVIKGANGVGKVVDDTCSEIVKIYVTLEGSKVVDAKFQAFGSPAIISCSAVATAMIIGKTLEAIKSISAEQILNEVGGELPENKSYVPGVVETALKNLVANCNKKRSGKKTQEEDEE